MPLADSGILGINPVFVSRVQPALLTACFNIFSEGTAVANHRDRVAQVHAILANPTNVTNFSNMFALAVATDSSVLADATQASTVTLTTGNVAAQQALVTDAHINNAISAMFNAFVPGIPA